MIRRVLFIGNSFTNRNDLPGTISRLENRERMHEYITLFDEEIKRAGAKTVLYLTWARKDALNDRMN
jgi:hypothetical protein